MQRVAVYTRLSVDEGNQTATKRQESGCRSLASVREWQVVRVYEDVDVSAYRRGVVRPEYEAMLDAIEAGSFDGVLVWKLDRLVRRTAEFETFWSACEKHGIFLASVTEPIDSTSHLGIAIVRMLVAFAALESATMSTRLKARAEEKAHRGMAHTPFEAYGLRRGWKELEPTQASNIREAAARVLAGENLNAIVSDWNRRGIPALKGGTWSRSTLHGVMTAHRLTGDRAYKGTVVATDCFPAALDRATGEKVRELLQPTNKDHARHYRNRALLAGVLRCARCGHNLSSGRDRQRIYYMCPSPPAGCAGIHVVQHAAESTVIESVLGVLSERARHPGGSEPTPISASTVRHVVEELVTELKELSTRHYVYRSLSRVDFIEERNALLRQFETSPELEQEWLPASLRGPSRASIRAAWEELAREEQRQVVRGLVDHVVVHPGRAKLGVSGAVGGTRSNPNRLEIVWRHDLSLRENRLGDWTTVTEAAELLSCDRRQVYALLRDGALLGERLGRMWMVRRDSADAHLAEVQRR